MSLLVLSHLIQFAALYSVGVLNIILSAVLGGSVGLFAGPAWGLAVFRVYTSIFASFVQHPWGVGLLAYYAALMVGIFGWGHRDRTAS
ncbi:hypothetical protein [Burkholderia vietnamiensis]|uniref:hypothetical protein n=1 Tax=Burkholderia vietnamiensis TaxID=60552 RepID=UPI001CF47AF8|nr:hypothetical protein [Burkholderia vietnamiensis]MCA8287554.1 hypothetical protein [Burkholderia vietnamiensis]